MVRELKIIFGLDPVSGELGIARHRLVFLVSCAALPRERLSWRLLPGLGALGERGPPPRPRRRPF
jgi:hypothetical protein